MTFKTLLLSFLLLLAAAGCSEADDADGTTTPDGNGDGMPFNGEPTEQPGLSESDQAQIYAAAIRQIYTIDHSFGESPGWSQVYVVTMTDDSTLFDAPKAPPQTLSADLQEAVATKLNDLSFELIWVDSAFEVLTDPTNDLVAGGNGIIISLGNIHPQDDGSVQLPFFMTCGGLCGIGKTYVLSRVDDAWQVTGSVGPEIMS